MSDSITLPFWAFLPIALLAAWSLLVLLLVPGMRWFLRRKINEAIEEIGSRLQVELPIFHLARRQVLIDRLFHDPVVQAAAAQEAKESGRPLREIWRGIDRHAREIVPSFNAYLYFRIGYAIARRIARTLYRVRIGFVDDAALARVEPRSTIVFVMNHRSNMDYILVAFLAAERAALSYAVGEWARIWPLQQLVRAMGGYFVRRHSGDPLYRTVLARYVHMACEGGVTQAVFPEGGLTRDGRLGAPRYGLFDYMARGFRETAERDIVFIPVGLNYDRVLEDRNQLRRMDADARRPPMAAMVGGVFRFLADQLRLRVAGRWFRFGYACVNFGEPVSLRTWVRERSIDFPALGPDERHERVGELARHVLDATGHVVPVLPVALVATVLVAESGRTWEELELKAAALARLREFEARGARIYVPRSDLDYAFGVGLRMLVLRRMVERLGGGELRPVATELPLLRYYANSIAHL
jgi:glycerol-3-phosphate O-acyltransferase